LGGVEAAGFAACDPLVLPHAEAKTTMHPMHPIAARCRCSFLNPAVSRGWNVRPFIGVEECTAILLPV
jgi:hypothetical protein